jgi:hypothetical protein
VTQGQLVQLVTQGQLVQLVRLVLLVLLVLLDKLVRKVSLVRLVHRVNLHRSTTTRLMTLQLLATQATLTLLTTTPRKLRQRNYKFHTLIKMDMTLTSSLVLSRLTMFFTSKMQAIQTTSKSMV